jgi:hypothetical protein
VCPLSIFLGLRYLGYDGLLFKLRIPGSMPLIPSIVFRDRLNSRCASESVMSLQFSTGSIDQEGVELQAAVVELENAVIALIWAGDRPRLGSMTATLPNRASSQLLGDRDEVLSRMVGERLASRRGKLVLVSSNLPTGFQVGRPLLELMDELVGERVE